MHKALLATTPQDWSDGGIDQIKCKVCADTELKGWEEFKHHCGTAEAHPLKIMFCNMMRGQVRTLGRHSVRSSRRCIPFPQRRALGEAELIRRMLNNFMRTVSLLSVSFLSFGPASTRSPGQWAVIDELAI